jgi:hypothetical protein
VTPERELAWSLAPIGVAIAITLSAACAIDKWDAPPKPTPDAPCGLGVVCEDGSCCPQGFTCAGPHSAGVPVGMCEFIEPTEGMARRDGGTVTRTVPQRVP